MIHFTRIYIEGFCSIGNVKINLNKPGWNLLTGENGAGKTSIFSALTWAIFGKTLKAKNTVNTWKHLRGSEYKGTKVKVDIVLPTGTLTIIRCEAYRGKVGDVVGKNNLFVYMNREEQTKFKDKKDKQKYIERTIGVSYNLFTNSILFGQKMKRFIEESGPNQKNIFDEVFNTDFINKVREKVKVDYDEIDAEYEKTYSKVLRSEEYVSLTKELYLNTKKTEEDFIQQKTSYIKNLKKKIIAIKSEVKFTNADSIQLKSLREELASKNPNELEAAIKEKRKKYADISFKLSGVKSKVLSIQNSISHKEKEIKECGEVIKMKAGDKCPTCGGIMNKEKVKEKVRKGYLSIITHKRALKILLESRDNWKAKEKRLTGKLSSVYKILNNKELKLASYNKLEKSIGNLLRLENEKLNSAKRIEDLKKLITEKEREKLTIKSTEIKVRLDEENKKLKNAEAELEVLKGSRDELAWLMKGPLSNNGLKTFIFSSMVEDINSKLEAYSSVLGFKVRFGITDNTRKDFYIQILNGRNIIPYTDLSGGQQQLVNVAIAFSLHDIVSQNLDCNILIMDEIFENLSSRNIEKVTELIYKKVSNKLSLYLVTHKNDYSPTNSREVRVVLEKGISRYYTQ